MIRTIKKAQRIQQARFRAGKYGWARAVRRFTAQNPGSRGLLQHLVRMHDAEGARAAARVRAKVLHAPDPTSIATLAEVLS